jgi:hypothetical protein
MNMKKLMLLAPLFLAACSTPVSTATDANKVYINSTMDYSKCKFLGLVETKDVKNWQKDLRVSAGELGASHIQSSGPNSVGFNEIVSGNAYLCQ